MEYTEPFIYLFIYFNWSYNIHSGPGLLAEAKQNSSKLCVSIDSGQREESATYVLLKLTWQIQKMCIFHHLLNYIISQAFSVNQKYDAVKFIYGFLI